MRSAPCASFTRLDCGMDSSDVSSADTVALLLHLGGAVGPSSGSTQQHRSLTAPNSAGPHDQLNSIHSHLVTGLHGGAAATASASAASSTAAARRPVGGYRKLWAVVSRVQRGQGLQSDAEEVSVEKLVKALAALPAAARTLDAVAPSLPRMDARALAALLKGLAKSGAGARAVEIFDYLRCAVGQSAGMHCSAQLCLDPGTQLLSVALAPGALTPSL